jgi:uncharacterized protein YecE (DUF72 family)
VVKVRVGTSGYSYKEWKGRFYPEDLPAAQMLRFYAERFPTVEINNTFYRMPEEKTLEQWKSQVPDAFRFVLKAPQRITHKKRLADVADDVQYLLRTAEVLGESLGPMLFQLPPYFRKDLARLRDFLSLVPRGRVALEFRHVSWFDDEVLEALRGRAAALCNAQTDETTDREIRSTADWGYLRLRKTDYSDEELRDWSERLRTQPWSEAYVFFKHEDEAKGPQFAARFASLISG